MKNRAAVYEDHQYASTSEPRYVVRIEFSPASFETFASHTGITDIPAGVIESTVEDFSAVSQSFDPETGASRIGNLTVTLGDIAGAVTDAFQARLAAGTGVRGKQLTFYKGFEGMSFNDFELKWTQDVHDVSEDHARYKISCSDLQRAMRTEIFDLKKTVLDATLSATATTATVADTSEFILVEHGTSYSHGPSATWGYFQLDDEIIGYTGKTGITFTGLDRGLFNTKQAEHVVDPADPPERRPEIEEYVYLELPIPKLAKALLTGVLHGQGAATLPDHWHMGIAITLIEDSQFTGIGPDLWDPADDTVGLPARFTDIGSIDGKRFIESECFLLAQIFSPVLASGNLGLRRFTPALAQAAHLITLNETNVVKHSALKHQMREVFNRIVLNWSWISGRFRRQTLKLDTDSIAKHGKAPIKIFNFRGLAANIATQSVLTQRFDAIRDRFSAPPLALTVQVSKSLDNMELGDVVLVQLPNVRDMAAGTDNPIDRAFEIRQIREDRKRLIFSLSGSAVESLPTPPASDALADAFYDSAGTELSTVVTIVADVTAAGTFTLVGDPLLASSVFYYLGNLTIAAGTTLNIDDNCQLRVRGFLTVNGVINGVARGLAGVVDSVVVGGGGPGTKGFFGATVGGAGARVRVSKDIFSSRNPDGGIVFAEPSAPHLNLIVDGNNLRGLPTDLRGCSGGPGGKLVTDGNLLQKVGGTGGDGGSGLMIICRGMSFGVAASIDLSGGAGQSGVIGTLGGKSFFPGGGGGGAPGAFYVLLDGNRLVPGVTSKFTALGGDTPIDGTPIVRWVVQNNADVVTPATGARIDSRRLSNVDWSAGAFRVQFIPIEETPVEDLPDEDLTVHYILATNGTAIHNGTGTLTLEAHRLRAGIDELLSAGTIKLFDPSDNELTVANGYVTGSDGYTGILDSGDILNDIIITLKDGATGTPLDTITLVDIADGAAGGPGADGDDAVYGFIEPENGLAWTRAPNAGAWTPAQLTTDLDCTFVQGGVEVARIARRITLTSGTGFLAATSIVHKGGDLNTGRVTVTVTGSASTAITVKFAYSFTGDDASVAETVNSSQGGDDGAVGAAGDDAVAGFVEDENGAAWTRATNAGAWTPSQLTTDLDCTFVQGGVPVARIARRVTLTSSNGTLAATSTIHKDGDLNTSRITVTVTGGGSTAITVKFDYSFGGDDASTSETVISSQGGDDGATGGAGADGDDAVAGFVEDENGVAWTRATNAGAWTPLQLTTDLDCTFVQGGVPVARIARRVTLTSSNGTFAATSTVHKDGDLNTGRVTVTVTGGGSTAITVKFDYSFSGDSASTAETVISSQGGDDGAVGADGSDAVTSQLTNHAHTVPTDFDGNNIDLTGSGGTHKVDDGGTDVTTSAVHSVVGGSGSPSELTQNGLKFSIIVATGVYTLSETTADSWSTDVETFTVRAVYNSQTLDTVYTITKSKAGAPAEPHLPAEFLSFQTVVSPGTAQADITFKTTGVIEITGFTNITWHPSSPITALGDDFEVRCESLISGTWDVQAATVGTWVALTADRLWRMTRITHDGLGSDICRAIFQVRLAANVGVAIAQGIGDAEAQLT